MSDLNEIKSINEGSQLHRRARAYVTNHPRVSFADAVAHLTAKDQRVARVRTSLAKARV